MGLTLRAAAGGGTGEVSGVGERWAGGRRLGVGAVQLKRMVLLLVGAFVLGRLSGSGRVLRRAKVCARIGGGNSFDILKVLTKISSIIPRVLGLMVVAELTTRSGAI